MEKIAGLLSLIAALILLSTPLLATVSGATAINIYAGDELGFYSLGYYYGFFGLFVLIGTIMMMKNARPLLGSGAVLSFSIISMIFAFGMPTIILLGFKAAHAYLLVGIILGVVASSIRIYKMETHSAPRQTLPPRPHVRRA